MLYSYWAHDRGVASEYWAKFYLVKDSIRMRRSDGALVRIMADMLPGEKAAAAEQGLIPFTSEVFQLLDVYIPRVILERWAIRSLPDFARFPAHSRGWLTFRCGVPGISLQPNQIFL